MCLLLFALFHLLVVFCSSEMASQVYAAAEPLGILGPSWVWIVSEQAASVSNVPQGNTQRLNAVIK